ncbi:MAG: ROK family protein, partial [Bryobacteraceae bacterium]
NEKNRVHMKQGLRVCYYCSRMAEYSIGVDLGGTNLRAAAIGRDGEMLLKVSGGTPLEAGRDAVIRDIVASIVVVREKLGAANLAGVGIGVPGFILIDKGIILGSNNLPDLEGFPVRDEIEKLLGTKVVLENDANAAALGEKWMGAGQTVNDLVLLTLGTGIGGGVISRGRVIHGQDGMAGELGHITVVPNGNPCGCGNYGCLEKHASATAVVSLARMMSLGADLTAEDVYRLAAAGDERARMIFQTMGSALGVALALLINIFNFPLYLLSGGMLPGWDMFAPKMMEEIERRSFTYRNSATRVEKAILGNEAGLFGAAYLPFQALEVR